MAKERSRERASELRKRAEIILAEDPQAIRTMAITDIQKLIHELNVHQIELEMQNAELRRVQLELQEARDKYLSLYDFAPTGYFTLDHNSLIVDVNLAGSELLGSEKHRLIGAQFTSSISPDSQDAFYFHYREVLKTGIKGNCELKVLKADGTPFHAQVISMAVPEKDGNVNQCRVAVIDITERKRAEDALRDSEEKWRSLVENAPNIIMLVDGNGTIQFINRTVSGFDAKDTIGTSIYDYIQPEHHNVVREAFNRVFKTGKFDGYEIEGFGPDGSRAWYETRISPIKHDSEVVGVIQVISDITERKRSEHQASERMKELQAFYSLAEITEREGITLDKMYQELTNILPKSWQYTENAYARIVIGDSEFRTKNFAESAWKQSAPVKVNRSVVGRIDVGYLEQKPEEDEGPFLKEERLVIDTIAERLGHITERKQAEEALRESEERYRTLFESAAEGIFIADMETKKFKYSNPAICTMLGYSQEELTKMDVGDIHPKASLEHALAEFGALARGEKTLALAIPCLKKDGTVVYADISAAKAIIDGRECNIGFFTDITERKRAEEEIRVFSNAVAGAIDAIVITDMKGTITYTNSAAEEVYGYEKGGLIGKSVFVLEQNPETIKKKISALIETGGWYGESEEVKKNKGTFPALLSLSIVRDDKDNPMAMMGAIRDITEHKRAEDAFRESEAKYSTLVENSTDGIVILQDGVIKFVSPISLKLVGYHPEELVGTDFIQLVTPENREAVTRRYADRIAGKKVSNLYEISLTRKDGTTVPVEVNASVISYQGRPADIVLIRDITERKQAQQAQGRLTQQLQAQVSELETFSYGIAHDLRSPLVSIEGFSRLLREDIQNQNVENVQEDIRLLESGVKKMQGFLNSTLEYSRSGQMIKRTKNVSFGKIVNEVITEFNGQISSIGATVSTAKSFPRVYADRNRIIQVLTNLIQNSIKYRDKTVPLKIDIGHRLSKGETIFFVRDNGLGIDASSKEKLFTLFYRGTADGEGSGIGLAIVKKIIEAHGGMIWVQQGQSKKGTTMCFTLSQKSDTNKGDNNGKD